MQSEREATAFEHLGPADGRGRGRMPCGVCLCGLAAAVSAALESVASRVAPNGSDADIEFDFRQVEGELVIEARCGSRTSEVRCPLPA